MEEKTNQNRLINEQSPYLLQHAENPVDWYPWGEEAFTKAREEDKPIFLSIGYSTCHWCHVMEHESFEDPEIGALINEVFVSIKVDREERPDIDGVYMTVSQMMTGGGGWPLTIIMTPDKEPFYTATYIPRESRGQTPGMREFISAIKDAWLNRREQIVTSVETISREIRNRTGTNAGGIPEVEIAEAGFTELAKRFDTENGGFSVSPKFPSPHNLLFLLRFWKESGNEKSLSMVTETLNAMRKGGIYDQLGGGFHRYATDRAWNVPHFEKMLYDQAMLTMAYTEAFQVIGDPLFEETIRGILEYVLRDMASPEGGFYSAEDADSEGEEGKFYIWSHDELVSNMSQSELTLFSEVFSVTETGNYKDEATGSLTGLNILYSENEALLKNRDLESVRNRLFKIREKRVHPFKDDKILTDWNGLMIAAMAKAGRILNEGKYIDAAERAGKFILNKMEAGNGSLYHRFRQGERGIQGYLEDYIFGAWGFLSLYEATFDVLYLEKALELADYAVSHFWDGENFGFYSVSDSSDPLLFREKESYDGAIPSGNSAAMDLFLKLGRITGRKDLIETAENTARAFSEQIESIPAAYTHFISGLSMYYGVPREVIIIGESGDPTVSRMLEVLKEGYYPNTVFLFVPSGPAGDFIRKMIPYLENYKAVNGNATVYVCSNYSCELPTGDPEVMRTLLQ